GEARYLRGGTADGLDRLAGFGVGLVGSSLGELGLDLGGQDEVVEDVGCPGRVGAAPERSQGVSGRLGLAVGERDPGLEVTVFGAGEEPCRCLLGGAVPAG